MLYLWFDFQPYPPFFWKELSIEYSKQINRTLIACLIVPNRFSNNSKTIIEMLKAKFWKPFPFSLLIQKIMSKCYIIATSCTNVLDCIISPLKWLCFHEFQHQGLLFSSFYGLHQRSQQNDMKCNDWSRNQKEQKKAWDTGMIELRQKMHHWCHCTGRYR